MRGRSVLTFVFLGITGLLAACGLQSQTESLSVTINGLPGSVAGAVTITGSGGYSKVVTSTTTLKVDAGTYTVAVASVSDGGTIVPAHYDGTASKTTVTLAPGGTGSTVVTYAKADGTGAVWVPMARPVDPANPSGLRPIMKGFLNDTLAGGGFPGADVTLSGAPPDTTYTFFHEAAAFDGSGNVWVSDLDGYIKKYAPSSLAADGEPQPIQTIDASAFGGVFGLAFDAQGDLWAAFHLGIQIVMYSASQLATGADVSQPALILTTVSNTVAQPAGLAFDANGGLWVANSDPNVSTIVRFPPSLLTAPPNNVQETRNAVPDVTIGADSSPSLVRPFGLAFDTSGNLWVADHENGNVLRYNAAQLAQDGTPAPAMTLTTIPSTYGATVTPTGIAFDHSGDLWLTVPDATKLIRFSAPGNLSGTTSVAPDLELGVGTMDAGLLAFDPPPGGHNISTP